MLIEMMLKNGGDFRLERYINLCYVIDYNHGYRFLEVKRDNGNEIRKHRLTDDDILKIDNYIDELIFPSPYYESEMIDGGEWTLLIADKNRNIKVSSSNQWPNNWEEVRKLYDFIRSIECRPIR